MFSLFRLSRATSLAFHAMALTARSSTPLQTREMAGTMRVSEAHLSKVLQRLAKAGLLRAKRGPGGGFELGKKPNDITLREILEAIEGHVDPSLCPLDVPICDGGSCPLGDKFREAGAGLLAYLSDASLSQYERDFRTGGLARENE